MTKYLVSWVPGLLVTLGTQAQPAPPSFCFVLAENDTDLKPFGRTAEVFQYYRERVAYVGVDGSWLKPEVRLPLQGGPVFIDSSERWTAYSPLEGMAASRMIVVVGDDTMRMDLPEQPDALQRSASARWDRATPEVVRFREGRFAMEELITDARAATDAKTLAERLIKEADASYEKLIRELEEHYRDAPPPTPPPAPYVPPPPMTQEQWEAEVAKLPGLEKVALERVAGDTVQVRITGRVMLDGGCASSMPLMAVELLTDSGWIERLPMHDEQLDCGLSSADWTDRQVTILLAWWVYNFRNGGDGLLVPGTYRLRFRGANMKDMRTAEFLYHR